MVQDQINYNYIYLKKIDGLNFNVNFKYLFKIWHLCNFKEVFIYLVVGRIMIYRRCLNWYWILILVLSIRNVWDRNYNLLDFWVILEPILRFLFLRGWLMSLGIYLMELMCMIWLHIKVLVRCRLRFFRGWVILTSRHILLYFDVLSILSC